MLEFIDRFTEKRFRDEPELRAGAFWIGHMPARELAKYLSADSPEDSAFVADVGSDWYDADYLETHRCRSASSERVIGELAASLRLPTEVQSALLERCHEHEIVSANTVVILNQHAWDGVGASEPTLQFLGNFEYAPRPPAVELEFRLFLAGMTTADRDKFARYIQDGDFAADIAAALPESSLYPELDVRWDLVEPSEPVDALTPAHFFSTLPTPIEFPAGFDVDAQCESAGVDRINAVIRLRDHPALKAHRLEASRRFLGLRQVGWMWVAVAEPTDHRES
ncbi:immunity 22 family protein [Cumulibacter soli]|uniref:immunity 22 family protein n=1 Tax=Cumulibacter soli TaxID=2546344 RepID=UPI0010675491|nr:immunity 22 family protein [Cumulibacter soli]